MKKILITFGTRPEAIKMCPLVIELKKRSNCEVKLCVTGQHREMLSQVLELFGVEPEYNLSIMKDGQSLTDITTAIMTHMDGILAEERPDVILVHGDTTTTFAAALSGFYKKIDIGHVEAGLRTHNILAPYPEEFNRHAVSIISRYNFAPTKSAAENLIAEGVCKDKIWVTGNTVIDALRTTVAPSYSSELLDWAENSRLIFLTAHRRESLGRPLHNMLQAVRKLADEFPDIKVIYPVHMNPLVRQTAEQELGGHKRIRLTEPLNAIDCHNIIARSYLVMTDSGGIQEEAPSLGIPVIVMRDVTERPEGVEAGTLKVAGTDKDVIFAETARLLQDTLAYKKMATAQNPYGDGHASQRIADILLGKGVEEKKRYGSST